MTVAELIEKLRDLPDTKADVYVWNDGWSELYTVTTDKHGNVELNPSGGV